MSSLDGEILLIPSGESQLVNNNYDLSIFRLLEETKDWKHYVILPNIKNTKVGCNLFYNNKIFINIYIVHKYFV